MGRTLYRLLFGALLLVGVVGLSFGGFTAYVTQRARSWPTATGEIIATSVEPVEKRRNRRTVRRFQPRVRYAYVVDGERYENDKRAPYAGWEPEKTEADARVVIERYPVGTTVDVLYDPGDPDRSALEATWDAARAALLGSAALMAVALIALRQIRRRSDG